MPPRPFLDALQQRRPVFGFAHMIQDSTITETFRHVELDFVLIDMQHVAITIETLQSTLIALQPSPVSVLVRPACNEPTLIGQVLDAGADGVVVPMVNTAEEARNAVTAAKYPPDGMRSWGSRRSALAYESREAFASRANDDAIVLTQVETSGAVENIDDILTTPGLSGIMIGPADLAISLGHMHDRDHEDVEAAMRHVLDRCLHHGVPFGLFGASVTAALPWLERGGLIFNCGADTMFVAEGARALASAVARVRSGRAEGAARQVEPE